MGVTARQFVDKALSYEGYREKNHANANLEDFYNDAGDGNHTLFQQISVGWTGDQWCQYFVDGIAVMLTGSREAAKELLCQEKLSRMTGYTPDGAACFIDAGRWHYNPEVGDIIYFWSQLSGQSTRPSRYSARSIRPVQSIHPSSPTGKDRSVGA